MGCGLGKTAVVLSVVNELFHDAAINGVLVVAPLRVCNITWPAEVRKWDQFRWMKVANLRTPEGWAALERGDAHVYIINYEMLPMLQEEYLKGRRGALAFDTVVWDELTRAKNHRSKRVRAVLPYIRAKFKRHWGLTGTPTPNGLLDLFAQVRLLDGGERLGKSFSMYRSTYFRPTDYMEYNWVPQEGARERIYKRLEGFALTLLSSDWLDIPDVVQEDVEVTLDAPTRATYEKLQRELFVKLDDDNLEAVNAAVLTNKLLQVVSGAVYVEEKRWRELGTAKFDAFVKLMKRLRKEATLVSCQYQHEQDRIRAAFPQAVFFQDAKTPKAQEELAARWNRGEIPLLVAHPASIGHGLNLQEGGSTVVWYTLPWSPELYDQFNARVARRGQNAVTTIYRLLAEDTVDYAVVEALRSKDREQSSLLNALKSWRESKLRE